MDVLRQNPINWSPPTRPSEESVILEGIGEGKNLSVIPSLLILI